MTIKEIDQLLEEGNSLKQISQAYSEIANQKLKRIREEVERNRLFFEEISKVYALVRALAIKKGISVKKPKKRVCILQTSNYRFYGNINNTIIDFFIQTTKNWDTDRVIIGKTGIEYFQSNEIFPTFTPMVLKNDHPSPNELNAFVNVTKTYNQVLIFYSKLKSLLVQEPSSTDITQTSKNISLNTKDEQSSRTSPTNTHFIFEPEIAKTLQFFDSQVLILQIEQAFLESEVARTASRFISMDQAETEANKFIKEYNTLKAYSKRNMRNNQLLESITSILAVKKE